MKSIIQSVIEEGNRSKSLNELIRFCHRIASTTINISRYKNFLLEKSGLSVNDLAYDSIADLFICEKGKYIFLDSYFKNILSCKTEDEILSKLYALVISRTNQRIVELREEYGELYFKIKKAVSLSLCRNRNVRKVFYNSVCFIHYCELDKLNPKLEEIPEEELLQLLFSCKLKKVTISKIVNRVLDIVNSQVIYLRAISEIKLFNVILEFYKKRLKDYLNDLENVQYINIEVEL